MAICRSIYFLTVAVKGNNNKNDISCCYVTDFRIRIRMIYFVGMIKSTSQTYFRLILT